ncbi:putative benzoate 4-monooxygenase cytochrome P450 [Lojkania enalia]|uniref:Benzoate 4-monooxygenase cytochrome P450 n=1 Tax=Lojkania enalia TaxID=147567 RepID=A0A9P4K4A8_9PLEO|nr:putative benzoate 4-monooxygenase cytochrome P450 [Didymosphaeria enalia]
MNALISLLYGTLHTEILLAAVAGVISHIGFYKHGEHHMKAPLLFWLHVVLFSLTVYGKSVNGYFYQSFKASMIISTVYLLGLLASIVVYRRFFHRLRSFPGPTLASITKLWHVAHSLDSQNHLLLDGLYKKYGDFVRTGPSEITVFNQEATWAINGPSNNCTKAAWYDILLPLYALNTIRSKQQHDQRRRAWEQAISFKTMSGYEERIQSHGVKLEKHIASTAGESINMTQWFYFLAFDVMGDFAFAKSFNMLESKEWHYAVVLLRRALGLLGPVSSVPWLAQLAFSFPVIPIIRDWNRMIAWCAERMAEQIQISSWLIRHAKVKSTLSNDKPLLNGDSVALIVAGSDTVASTMVNIFYRLAIYPKHAEKVRQEVNSLSSVYDIQGLKNLEHMNGVINEVLRLHPSVPTGGYRETPPEGLDIAGTWIPGNTTIIAPRYTIGRLERLYKQPEEFIPERWYSRPELVLDKKSFNPFNIGRYSCIGKNLALAEIRFVTALLVSKYHITLAPGEDGISVWKDMKDQFTAVPGKLELVFTPIH